LNRFAGSIAFVAAARAAFAVIEDSEDDGRRLLLQAKNNLGAKCNGLAFRLEQRIVDGDILSSNVMFESDHVSQSIDEALTASESRGAVASGQTSKDEAAECLSDVLAHGPRDVLEVEASLGPQPCSGLTSRCDKTRRSGRPESCSELKPSGKDSGREHGMS
jgi:putative DNA primase/helicase